MTDNNTEDERKIVPMEDDEGGAPIYTEDGELIALHFASFQELSIPDEDGEQTDRSEPLDGKIAP